MKLILFFVFSLVNAAEIDPQGYVVFCPCMGRFGNQIDQLLGVMDFARNLDRTLVLPNFIEFKVTQTSFVPFESLFQLNPIKQYLKVITMHDFMKYVAPNIWPEEKRNALCWSPRRSIFDSKAPLGCHPKEGNPFGPYWDKVNVNFIEDEYFGDIPGAYELETKGSLAAWLNRFNSSAYPVLAFPSAPASFPSRSKVWELQKYLRWNSRVLGEAKQFISNTLIKPFVGIHLRNERDWVSVCEHIDIEKNTPLFASAQCLGVNHHKGKLTKDMCFPSTETILNHVLETVGNIGAKSVFVSSDNDHMIEEINDALKPYDIQAYKLTDKNPYVSLAILGLSDHFVGNCVSTFSHIVKRERDNGKIKRLTTYFGMKKSNRKIEL